MKLMLWFRSPDVPSPASAYICMSEWGEKDGRALISWECAGIGELEACIDELILQLESIRREGRRKFAKHKARFKSR